MRHFSLGMLGGASRHSQHSRQHGAGAVATSSITFPANVLQERPALARGTAPPGWNGAAVRWSGMGGSGTGITYLKMLSGAWRATARGRTLGRRLLHRSVGTRSTRGGAAPQAGGADTPWCPHALRTGPVSRARHSAAAGAGVNSVSTTR